ncbi:MAG: cytidine deaminase [Spirochaetales bacterium]|nr:cytidine deaminase [Candidatus Physcosoma equi]
MIKAFLFDVDGVLTDTSSVSMDIVVRYYKSKGYLTTRDAVRKHLGMGTRRLFEGPAKDLGAQLDYEDAYAYLQKNYLKILSEKSVALPGSADLIRNARKAGILCAVASSAPRWRVEANLKSLGLTEEDLDLVVTGEDIKRNKPCPDIYTKCLLEFGLDGKEAIVFEDAPGGMEAAKRAGCYVCALTTTVGRGEAKEYDADAVIENLSYFPAFSKAEEVDVVFRKMRKIGPGAVKYGANWIMPLERKMPQEYVEKKAIEAALAAMANAYVPYSHFRVGAAVVSAATGRIYSGCNVENAGYGDTICAERNAITTAVANEGAVGLDLVVVTSESESPAEPCGSCRQVMSEFIRPETPVVLVNTEGKVVRYVFEDLLPHPFDFDEE